MEAAVRQITDAGLWVIVTVRAKYAAGYTWPKDPDVFHNAELKTRFYAMWRYVVRHLSTMDRIAGYEIMSGVHVAISTKTFALRGRHRTADSYPRFLCYRTSHSIGQPEIRHAVHGWRM